MIIDIIVNIDENQKNIIKNERYNNLTLNILSKKLEEFENLSDTELKVNQTEFLLEEFVRISF